ncbi:hypothetical protein ACI784_20085 [Geodermatophilus sp. SYSU D01186]
MRALRSHGLVLFVFGIPFRLLTGSTLIDHGKGRRDVHRVAEALRD